MCGNKTLHSYVNTAMNNAVMLMDQTEVLLYKSNRHSVLKVPANTVKDPKKTYWEISKHKGKITDVYFCANGKRRRMSEQNIPRMVLAYMTITE